MLHAFGGAPDDGAAPEHGTLATDGTVLYGLTAKGGSITNAGTFFKVNTDGTGYQTLHSFTTNANDGANPWGTPLLIGPAVYGMTLNGGTNGVGAIFQINTDGGGFQLLHSFGSGSDGQAPYGSLVTDGINLFGMTYAGGTNSTGTIFVISTNGTGYKILHSFVEGGADGWGPKGSLVLSDGVFYGLTALGGANSSGTIFRINTDGSGYQKIYDFGGAGDGTFPYGSLVVSNSTLYGMTDLGGAHGVGTVFSVGTNGLNYQLLHSFSFSDTRVPTGDLTLSNATLYGMAAAGGDTNINPFPDGAVFRMNTDGSGYQLVYQFSNASNDVTSGNSPQGSLLLLGGQLYGMTFAGGSSTNDGIVFSLGGTGGTAAGGGAVGALNVTMLPAGAATADAQWAVDGGNIYDNGTTITNVPAGQHTVFFSTVSGWTSPASQIVTINSGATTSVTGTYTPVAVGALKVTLVPAGAVTAGAQWEMDGGNVYDSGTTITNISTGPHTVFFSTVSGWTSPASQNITINSGATTSVTGTYTPITVTKPTLKIVTPTAGLDVSNSVFTATGTSSDSIPISGVYYQLNGNGWNLATTANNWANWSATNLNLAVGANTFSAYAMDTNNNVSATNSVSFAYVVSDKLVINIKGSGTIKPNLNGVAEPTGKTLTMVAKAAKGFEFIGWTGSISTNSPKLTFVMASNLQFTANFKDITRPVNAILSPRKNQVVTNSAPIASGRAKDNVGVTSVWFAVNGGGWMPAILPDGTNWTTPPLTLLSGPNSISAVAEDAAGNVSRTNTVLFKYMVEATADWAPDSLNGLLASVTPTNGAAESVGFDPSTFAQAGIDGDTNAEDYGAGTYSYVKTDTNIAQLSLAYTNPPSSSNNLGPITLVFTNHYSGYFTNASEGDTGGFNVAITTAFTPSTVSGKTIIATSSNSLKTTTIKLSTRTFVKTPANNSSTGTSSGNYTFTRYSPVTGMLALAFTDTADTGTTAYVQTTFTSATSGTYFVMTFDNTGTLQDTDNGRFTLK